jgi:hypothetical protein
MVACLHPFGKLFVAHLCTGNQHPFWAIQILQGVYKAIRKENLQKALVQHLHKHRP